MEQLIDTFCRWPHEAQYCALGITGLLVVALVMIVTSSMTTLVKTLCDFVVTLLRGYPVAEMKSTPREQRKLPTAGSVGLPPPPPGEFTTTASTAARIVLPRSRPST